MTSGVCGRPEIATSRANVNQGIRSINGARLVGNVRGQCFTNFLYVDDAQDITYFDIEAFPYWSEGGDATGALIDPNHYVVAWQQANGDCIWFKRADGPVVRGFVYGYRSGLRISASTVTGITGSVNAGQFEFFYPDACKYGLWVDGTVTASQAATAQVGNLMTGGETVFVAVIACSAAIQLDGVANLQLANVKLYFTAGPLIALTNTTTGSVLSFGNLIMVSGEHAAPTGPVISASSPSGGPHLLNFGSFPEFDVPGGQLINYTSTAIVITPKSSNYSYVGIGEGAIITFTNNLAMIFAVVGGGHISAASVILPANPYYGDEIELHGLGSIGTLTWPASVQNAPAALANSQTIRLKWIGEAGYWFYMGSET